MNVASLRPDLQHITTARDSNMRGSPDTAGELLRVVPAGSSLIVYGRSDKWLRVGDAQGWGWVHQIATKPIG